MSNSQTPKQTSKAPTPGTSTPVAGGGPGTKPLSAIANIDDINNNNNNPPLTSIDQLPPLPPDSNGNNNNNNINVEGNSSAENNNSNNPPASLTNENLNNLQNKDKVKDKNKNGDDDDASDASSEGYDFTTGNVVVSQNMSPQRKQEILARALKHKEHDTSMRIETYIKPLPPRRTAQAIRLRSQQVLNEAREVIAYDLGIPPRVVYDEETGYILPRESIVTIAKPLEVKDELGTVSLVAAPTTGFGLGGRFDDIEREKTTATASVTHYQRSVEALRYSQQQRLLRQLNLDQ